MGDWSRRGFIGALSGAAAATAFAAQETGSSAMRNSGKIKITDLKCAIIGRNPVVRIVTDQGISGYGEAESAKPYLKPMVLFYKDYLLGEDPTDVNRIMLKIRRMGASKPWGAAVSAIEIALWDVAGQAPDCRYISCWAERSTTAFAPMGTPKTTPKWCPARRRITPSWRQR